MKKKKYKAIVRFLETVKDEKLAFGLPFVHNYRKDEPIRANFLGWLPLIFPEDYVWVKSAKRRHIYIANKGTGREHSLAINWPDLMEYLGILSADALNFRSVVSSTHLSREGLIGELKYYRDSRKQSKKKLAKRS